MSRRAAKLPRIPKKPERVIQAECVAVMEDLGCKVERRNAGKIVKVDPSTGKRCVIKLGETGAADLFGRLPDGRHIDVEVKKDDERPELHQTIWLRDANRWAPAFWVDCPKECRKVVEALILGGRIVWAKGIEKYRVETKGRDGKKVPHQVDGPSAEFTVEF